MPEKERVLIQVLPLADPDTGVERPYVCLGPFEEYEEAERWVLELGKLIHSLGADAREGIAEILRGQPISTAVHRR